MVRIMDWDELPFSIKADIALHTDNEYVMKKLTSQKGWSARCSLAINKNISEDIVKTLLEQNEPLVMNYLYKNPKYYRYVNNERNKNDNKRSCG